VRHGAARQIVRDSPYVFTAVAPAEGKLTSLILPTADRDMMSLFLEPVSKTFAEDFLVMQVDRAGWHITEDLKIPENIRLIPQPAYSPELNWQLLIAYCPRVTGSSNLQNQVNLRTSSDVTLVSSI
jgi:hypothetical protein